MRAFIGALFIVVPALTACGDCVLEPCIPEGEGEEGEGEGEGDGLGNNDFSEGCPIATLDIDTCNDGDEILQADCDDGDRIEVFVTVDKDGQFFDCVRNGDRFNGFDNATLCDLDLDVPADRTQAVIRIREGCNGESDF